MAKIALLMSGGLSKGAYQIGALRALAKYFSPEDFTLVSASSIGVLNAQSYLTGHMDEMHSFWERANADTKRKNVVRFLHGPYLPAAIHSLAGFGQSPVPFYASLLQAKERTIYYADLRQVPAEDLESYLAAAVSVPVVNRAVVINSVKYADGGWVDNIPVFPLLPHTFDYVIGFYFDKYDYFFANEDLDRRVVRINFPNNSVISDSLFVDHESIMNMIGYGERFTADVLDRVIGEDKENVEAVLAKIATEREEQKNVRNRITADRMINGLSRVTNGFWHRAFLTGAPDTAAPGDADTE